MLLSELKVHNKWKACEGMWTLVLLPGVKFQDYINLNVSLPPLPASVPLIVFMSARQSSEVRGFYHNDIIWQDQRRAGLELENRPTTIRPTTIRPRTTRV